MSSPKPPIVRCRQIQDGDLDSIVDLLTEGFPDRSRKHWISGFSRLAARGVPEGFPRFGYMLENGGAPVGVLLLIFTGDAMGANRAPRFNLSSWYVKPEFRSQASLLGSMAMKRKSAVYLNTSPLSDALPMLNAMGFQPLSRGQFLSMPALSPRSAKARVIEVGPFSRMDDHPDPAEFELLRAHAAQDCVSLIVREGEACTPFVFLRRQIRYSPFRTLQLAYCRDTADFVRLAGVIGRFLLSSGHLLVICDANGPMPGLVGRYFDGKAPKYFRGPVGPRINDLAFTEAIVFGP